MQAPSSFEGLDRALADLGYRHATQGLRPDGAARDKLEAHIEWAFEQSKQTANDHARRETALAMVGAFPWGLCQTQEALRAAVLMLRSRKPSRPMRMRIVEQDEDGVAQSIEVQPEPITAATYRGRKVTLNKPRRTPDGPKKFAVYVKNPEGKVVKVAFGDPNMRIKKSDPARRKSFRARHKCDEDPGPKWKARYWSCRAW